MKICRFRIVPDCIVAVDRNIKKSTFNALKWWSLFRFYARPIRSRRAKKIISNIQVSSLYDIRTRTEMNCVLTQRDKKKKNQTNSPASVSRLARSWLSVKKNRKIRSVLQFLALVFHYSSILNILTLALVYLSLFLFFIQILHEARRNSAHRNEFDEIRLEKCLQPTNSSPLRFFHFFRARELFFSVCLALFWLFETKRKIKLNEIKSARRFWLFFSFLF